jgi:hypothetical protein
MTALVISDRAQWAQKKETPTEVSASTEIDH